MQNMFVLIHFAFIIHAIELNILQTFRADCTDYVQAAIMCNCLREQALVRLRDANLYAFHM